MSSSGDVCNARLKNSLLQTIPTRCYEIQCICEEFNGKDLYNAFPLLVEDIFGTENQVGWGLRRTFRSYNHQDFYHLVEFLRPQGVFFKMCYKLVSNNYFRYDFPLIYLPVKVREMIEDGMVPAFYMDKLKVDHQTRIPTALSLNSFEYYMFHFAYHLVNPWLQCDEGARDLWDTVYLQLAEEYVANFLPCSDSPVQPITGYSMSNSFSTIPLQTSNRPVKLPTLGLFRQSVLLSQTLTCSSYNSSPTSSQQNTRVEIWRSELVSQVFIDFWLSCESRSYENPKQMSMEQFYSPSAFASPRQSPTLANMQGVHAKRPFPSYHYPKLPSVEHMRVVRNLLKHIHYFANSSMGSGTAMDELKRIILPSSQGKIYSFLRRMIDLWPLDSSFRLVLETWLSYIQPWRYTGSWPSSHPREQDSHIHPVDRKWLDFIAENLLAYTVIFQQVVQRFSRIDLVTPKNAVMLFRTTKVFSQPGLSVLVRESESCLDESASSLTMSHKMCAIVRQQVVELEGPSYQYKFLFGAHAKVEVVHFCNFVNQAYISAYALQKTEELDRLKYPKTFLTAIADFFRNSPIQSGDYSLEERTKVTTYLEFSIENMCSIFKIDNFPIYRPEYNMPGSSQPLPLAGSPDTHSERSNIHLDESAMQMHTPNQISPEAARKRLRHIHYEGDPDLEPIKSTENAFLVRFLFQISSKLNEMYSDEMALTYYRGDFYGRVARQILCPPTLTRNYDKRFPGRHSPRVEIYLPPRLSLRTLASHWVLLYFTVAALIAHFRGYGPVLFIVVVFALWAMYVAVKAFTSPWIAMWQRETRNRHPPHLQDSVLDTSFIMS